MMQRRRDQQDLVIQLDATGAHTAMLSGVVTHPATSRTIPFRSCRELLTAVRTLAVGAPDDKGEVLADDRPSRLNWQSMFRGGGG